MLVPQLLEEAAQAAPDRKAIVVVGCDEMTYQQWSDRSQRIAQHLLSLGLAPGDRVALLLDNADAAVYLSAYVGIHRAGGVAVPCNTRFTPSELGYVLEHSGAQVVIHGVDHAQQLQSEHLPSLAHTLSAQALRELWDAGHAPQISVECTR